MKNNCSLSDMTIGQKSSVEGLKANGTMRRRLQDIGFVKGETVKCLFKSPGGNPIAYRIRGAVIALRKEDAENIVCKIK